MILSLELGGDEKWLSIPDGSTLATHSILVKMLSVKMLGECKWTRHFIQRPDSILQMQFGLMGHLLLVLHDIS
jgi:hypothetical protein